jgi:hypothetical protein
MQAANRASAWILIQNFYFGCNTGDEDHGSTSLFRFQVSGVRCQQTDDSMRNLTIIGSSFS